MAVPRTSDGTADVQVVHPAAAVDDAQRLAKALAARGLPIRLVSAESGSPADGDLPLVVVVAADGGFPTGLADEIASRPGPGIIPAAFGGLQRLEMPLARWQGIDFSGWDGSPDAEPVDRLVRALDEARGRSTPSGADAAGSLPLRSAAVELLGLARAVSISRDGTSVEGADVVLAAVAQPQVTLLDREDLARGSTSAALAVLLEPRSARLDAALAVVGARMPGPATDPSLAGPELEKVLAAATGLATRVGSDAVWAHHVLGAALVDDLPVAVLDALGVTQQRLRATFEDAVGRRHRTEPDQVWADVLGPAQPPPPADVSTSGNAVLHEAAQNSTGRRVGPDDVLVAALRLATDPGELGVASELLPRLRGRPEHAVDERLFTVPGGPSGAVPPNRVPDYPGVPQLLSDAARVRDALGFAGKLRLRHVLGAAVAGASQDTLRALMTSRTDLVDLFTQSVEALVPGEPAAAWRAALLPGGDDSDGPDDVPDEAGPGPRKDAAGSGDQTAGTGPVDTSAPQPRRWGPLTGATTSDFVDPDKGIPASEDALGVTAYVDMIAGLVVRDSTPMPLSVGLFGRWGSGKSFFMGLLRDRVAQLATTGDPDVYRHNVVQIGFNAWTYADTNIWASLGDTIFRRLAEHGSGSSREQLEASRERLRQDLESTLARREELEESRRRADEEAARLRTELGVRRAARTASGAALLAATATAAGRNVASAQQVEKAMKRLGVTDAAARAELLADELQGIRDDGRLWREAVTGRRGLAVAAFVLVGLVTAVVGVLAEWSPRVGVTSVLSGVTAALAGAGYVVARVRAGLRLLTTAAQAIRKEASTATERALRDEVEALDRAVARSEVAQTQLDEVLARAGSLSRELADLAPARRLYSFLADRAASEDYRSRLSLVSLIRRDLAGLVDRLKDEDPAQAAASGGRAAIGRIVLYIDDLDRCSPAQVVRVLEAVHLLLALDLFVVVVGVDPRWLLHSLRDQYATVLSEDPDDETTAGIPDREQVERRSWRSTPHDYLEKIFNVPFVLPGFAADGFRGMIDKAVADEQRRRPERAGHARDDTVDTDRGGDHASATTTTSRTDQPPPANLATNDAGGGSAGGSSGSGGTANVVPGPNDVPAAKPNSELDRATSGEKVEATALQPTEVRFLAALSPLVSSPRTATRFLNLYRMLRSTENLGDASTFLGDDDRPGDYHAVALLLGILTAAPDCFGAVVDAPAAEGTLGGLRARPGTTWTDFVDSMRPEATEGGARNGVVGPLDAREATDWGNLVIALDGARELVTLPDVSRLVHWARHVGRFSFHLAANPAERSRPATSTIRAGSPFDPGPTSRRPPARP